ncbi:MAG: hypothetical protein Q8N99_05530 [Nanoarchaeota archaeon]|nr:hypothetical protein [Nanoarchaeota archaeon]
MKIEQMLTTGDVVNMNHSFLDSSISLTNYSLNLKKQKLFFLKINSKEMF